jgi:Gpi18-like mannosyltransferase
MEPWAYLPLGLHIFTALGSLGQHTGWPFLVLGKLPTVVGDLMVGGLLYTALRRRGHAVRIAALGMGMYLFNPLVLYNGAFVGRFDGLALAFFLLALESYHTRLFAPAYAVAIAVKTFPLFLLPLLLLGQDRQKPTRLVIAGLLVIILSLPEVVTNLHGLVSHLLYNRASFGRLSWYYLILQNHWLHKDMMIQVAHYGLLLYPLTLLLFIRSPLYVKAALCFTMALVLSNVVYEQYLLWPLPFLIIVGLHNRSWVAVGLVTLCTVAGLLENEQTWSPYARQLHYALVARPSVLLNVILAASVFVWAMLQLSRYRVRYAQEERESADVAVGQYNVQELYRAR